MEKKNDILQTYRQRKEEFLLPLQEGSWERLEAALAEKPAGRQGFPYRLLTVAAIGLLCIAAGITLLFMNNKPETNILVDIPEIEMQQEEVSSQSQPADSSGTITPAQNVVPVLMAKKKESIAQEAVAPASMKEDEKEEEEQEKTEIAIPEEDKSKEAKEKPNTPNTTRALAESNNKQFPPYQGKKKNPYPGWAFGVSSGAGNFSGAEGGVSGYYFTNPGNPQNPPPPPEEPDNTPPDTKAAVGGKPGNSSDNDYYNHNMPISVGLSVRRYLTNRIALESGLSYTYLHSDITYKNKTKGNQAVHYLGIPLKLNWDILQKGPFSLYLSGGGMVEYCLSAQKESYTMDMKRWQYSLHGGIGLQYRFYKQLGLFVEPGVAYYIDPDPGYNLETIRSVHPLTFNLQIGFRFSY